MERFESGWPTSGGVEEGRVVSCGFGNVPHGLYEVNKKYVWVWLEDKPKDEEGNVINAAPPEAKWSEPQIAYVKKIRPEFQDLSVPASPKTIRFEDSSEGLPTTSSWRNSLAVADMNDDRFPD